MKTLGLFTALMLANTFNFADKKNADDDFVIKVGSKPKDQSRLGSIKIAVQPIDSATTELATALAAAKEKGATHVRGTIVCFKNSAPEGDKAPKKK